jgi:hypothetical protein
MDSARCCLFFGTLPRVPSTEQISATYADRMRAMHIARMEYESLIATQRVKRGLESRPPSESIDNVQTGAGAEDESDDFSALKLADKDRNDVERDVQDIMIHI